MIAVTGIKNGKRLEAVHSEGRFTFNGKKNSEYESEILEALKERYPVGGTYYVESENDTANIANVLCNYFFDSPTLEIKSDEDYNIPYEKGMVY